MSSSSSPSSSSSSPSSSSSSAGCAGGCEWTRDGFGQWQNTCFGCDADSFCREPGGFVDSERTATRCEPYGELFPSSSSGRMPLAAALTTAQGMIRLPNVHNPKSWSTFLVSLTLPWRSIQKPDLGWSVTLLRTPAGPATPQITPSHASVDVVDPGDKALCASVILPEAGAHNQYWVPVLDRYLWATLDTQYWKVLFLRLPMDS